MMRFLVLQNVLSSKIVTALLTSPFPASLPNFNLLRMSTSAASSFFINPSASKFTTPAEIIAPLSEILNFHVALPKYSQTSIIYLPKFAESLGLGTVIIKDERSRFGLPSFKPLGLAWAIRNAIISELSETLSQPLPSDISLSDLAAKAKEAQLKLITATDGKLGCLVARLGKYFGVESINTRIFVAEDTDESFKERIKAEGAEILVAPGDFEVATREAWLHSVATDGVLVNIDAEENYEDVPKWIIEGYSTMFQELHSQLPKTPPDMIILPVGTGGLAQAAVNYYKSSQSVFKTRIVATEPERAACLHASLLAGKKIDVEVGQTIMEGMSYGAVADAAWEVLKDGVDASTVVEDEQVRGAISELKKEGIDVGPCGGAVFAALKSLVKNYKLGELGLGADSTVVLICTDREND